MPRPIALTRAPSPAIADGELTYLGRTPIDFDKAVSQHAVLQDALHAAGCQVRQLPALPHFGDAVFVEDIAFVLPEVAIMCRPGAPSRRPEVPSVADQLEEFDIPLRFVKHPATVDGGDLLLVGRKLYVGLSRRTNEAGFRQIRSLVAAHGYEAIGVPVEGCLHLKTAATQVADDLVLLNEAWVDPSLFDEMERIRVDPTEPFAANALRINDTVLYSSSHPRTVRLLEARGIETTIVDLSELEKAEAGVTCCSIIFETEGA